MTKLLRITGERGRWLAKAEGRWLPVIHTTWWSYPTEYFDPMTGAKVDGKRHAEYVEALKRETLVILQRDKPGGFERDGYVGVFHFKDFVLGEDGSIRLTLVSRYANPSN